MGGGNAQPVCHRRMRRGVRSSRRGRGSAPADAAVTPCGPGIRVRPPRASEPVTAAFGARSYRPGDVASLRITARGRTRATLRLFRAGPGRTLRRLGTHATAVRPTRHLRLRAIDAAPTRSDWQVAERPLLRARQNAPRDGCGTVRPPCDRTSPDAGRSCLADQHDGCVQPA